MYLFIHCHVFLNTFFMDVFMAGACDPILKHIIIRMIMGYIVCVVMSFV